MVTLTEEELETAGLVHINVPWNIIHEHMNMIMHYRINVEIGFAADELDRVPFSELKATAARLHQRGCAISLHAPFWDLCPGSLDPLIRQITYFRLNQFFDVAAVFNPVNVVCHTGFDPRHHREKWQFWLEHSLAIWEPMVKRAEMLKAPLLLENVWEYDPDFHLALLEAIDSPWFGFCLDVGHQHSFSQTGLAEWLESLASFVKEVHIHDNNGVHDDHLPVGQGDIDFLSLFRFLRGRNIKPVLTLEPHREEHLRMSLSGIRSVLEQVAFLPVAGNLQASPAGSTPWP